MIAQHNDLDSSGGTVPQDPPTPTQTQVEPIDESETGLADIVVTAERREANVQDVPASVTAFDAAAIETLGITDMDDVALVSPGISFLPLTGSYTYITFRGSSVGFITPGTDPAVGTFVDDVYIVGLSGTQLELFDLDRIEVLRGPQGTLQGRNNTGGSFLIYTKRPSFDFDARARLTLGSYGRFDAQGYATGALIPDRLAAIISVDNRNYDGNYRNINPLVDRRDQSLDQTNLRASLLFTPSERLSWQLTGYYSRERNGGYEGQLFVRRHPTGEIVDPAFLDIIGPPGVTYRNAGRELAYGLDGSQEIDMWMVNNKIDVDLDFATLTSITAYRSQDFKERVDGTNASRPLSDTDWYNDDKQFSQELRLASPGGGALEWVAGAYYLNARSSNILDTIYNIIPGSYFDVVVGANNDADPTPYTYPSFQQQRIRLESFAIFGEAKWRFFDHFGLVLGGRYTWDNKRGMTVKSPGSGAIENPASPSFRPNFSVDYEADWKAFTPRVSLTYEPDDDILLFATYSRGYRSGGWSTEGQTPDTASVPFDPEKATNYEVGIKSRWFDNRLQVNTSLYHVLYEDVQSRIFVPTLGGYVSGNVGDVRAQGIDLEVLARPIDPLTVGFNYALLDAEYDRHVSTPAAVGANVPWTTPESLSTFADLAIPLTSGELGLHADVTWRGRVYFTENQSDPDYLSDETLYRGLVNAKIGYTTENKRIEVAAFARNLTDERVIIHAPDLSVLLVTSAELGNVRTYGAIYNAPRTFGVSLTLRN